jgi:CelD/BcsL family acetyltransferase involved in cellulose biosynthesis
LRLVLLKEIPEDTNLRRQWNLLVERMEQPQVFYTYEWALAVQRAYHATLRPLLFLAYDEPGTLTGVAALATDSENRAFFLCATTGDYCDFLSAPENRAVLVGGVFAELRKRGIREIALANLPADSCTVRTIHQAARRQRYHCFARTAYLCAQVELNALERRADGKPELPRRKMVRRFLSAMGREAPVRLEHARSWDAVESVLPQFIQAHVARFLISGRISNMARAERRVFLEELAKLLSGSGWLALTRMTNGEKSFAWNYGFQFQGSWFWYQPTFDSDLEKYSPGFCLLSKLIEEALENPKLKTVDMGLGAEEYKERFANHTRETLYVTLKTSGLRHFSEILRYRAAIAVKASPRIEAVVRTVASRVRRIATHLRNQGLAPTIMWLGKRLRELFWAEDEVFFFEWHGLRRADSAGLKLQPLDPNQLAAATMQYVDDPETLAYVLRSAQRTGSETAEGFVVVDLAGRILHLAWIATFEGFFLSELNAKVEAPSANSVMLFDCWTPVAMRGHGYYGQAIEMIALKVKAQGKQPWIFSTATNVASVRGIEKAGFQKRYSLVRQKALWRQRVKGQPPVSTEVPVAEVSARV